VLAGTPELTLLAAAPGCAPSSNPPDTGPPTPLFIRLLESRSGEPGPPQKALLGHESRDVLEAPYRSTDRDWPVESDGTLQLDRLLPLHRLSLDAAGALVTLEAEPGGPRQTAYVAFPGDDARRVGEVRLQVAADGAERPSIRGWAREALPARRSHVFSEVRIPTDADLTFAIGIDPDGIAPDAPSVRFSVHLIDGEHDHILFDQTLDPTNEQIANTWHEHTIDLERFTNTTVDLHFGAQHAGPADIAAPNTLVSLWANPVIRQRNPASPSPGRPNVLLISLDTLAARHLGAYGYDRPTSPNLDAFAAEALLFENAFAPAPWTTPSHASLFTGLHPVVHGAGALGKGYRLDPRWLTLAEIAYAQRYRTAAFTEGFAIRSDMGFDQGFERYWDSYGTRHHGVIEDTFGRAQAWMEEHRTEPFFLFLHTYEPHVSYIAPERFWRRFTETPPAEDMATNAFAYRDQLRNWYDAEIAYTDHVFGELIAFLRSTGLLERTLIVVTSDHGEEFFQHGGVGHIRTMYDEVLHIPLIVRLPGADPPRARIEDLVTLTDVFATVTDLMEWPAPATEDSYSLRLLWEPSTGSYPRSLVHSRLDIFEESADPLTGERIPWSADSLRTLTEKYMRTDRVWAARVAAGELSPTGSAREHVEEFIDLEADPGETRNLAVSRADRVVYYRELLLQRLTELEARREALLEGEPEVGEYSGLTPSDIEQLEALGYL
jgi:arylsulfatase A-like enzyme